MTKTIAISRFSIASIDFKNLLEQMKDNVSLMSQSSAESFIKYRQKLISSWNTEWHDKIINYKQALKALPKGLRQRDFIQTAQKEIDKFEVEFKKFSSQIKTISLEDLKKAINKQFKEANEMIGRFQTSIKELDNITTDLNENTLVQKFMRGEPVFSCRTKLQWRRKLFHASMGLGALFFFAYLNISAFTKNTMAITIIWLSIGTEIFRHKSQTFQDFVCWLFGPIMREHEKNKISAATYYIVSIATVYYIFPLNVAIMTVLFLAIGDPVAGIIGSRYGKHKLNTHVSIEGLVACSLTCGLIAFFSSLYLFENSLTVLPALFFAIIAGVIGAFAESSFKKIDDNLIMPLVSAPMLWILMTIMGLC